MTAVLEQAVILGRSFGNISTAAQCNIVKNGTIIIKTVTNSIYFFGKMHYSVIVKFLLTFKSRNHEKRARCQSRSFFHQGGNV